MNRAIVKVIWPIRKSGLRTFCAATSDILHGSHKDQAATGLLEKTNSTDDIPQYDVAIVGGGMVGVALACSLASMPLTKHLNVALIDSNPALTARGSIRKEDPPDPRVSTVTPATISFFKGMGAWKYIQLHRHAFFDRMQVWDYTGLGYARYSASDVDKEVLGCVVENIVLHRALLLCMEELNMQKTIYPARLSTLDLSFSLKSDNVSCEPHTNVAKLNLSNGDILYAKLVLGSDGSKSHVRELAGIKTTGWKYPQNAIICTVEHDTENRCAWQRFLRSGPIALLPIGDNFSNIVWTMDPKQAAECRSMDEAEFLKAVNEAMDYGHGPHPQSETKVGGGLFSWLKLDITPSANEQFEVPPRITKLASERMVFPLSLMHANSYVSKRVALIGDAAHTVHPLAGQGVNMGFGDASSLSRVIAEGVAVGSDIGELSLLRRYESERKAANIAMMAVLDGFQKAYSVDFGPLNILRAAAFHGANHISPLKRNIISYASGEQGIPLFS